MRWEAVVFRISVGWCGVILDRCKSPWRKLLQAPKVAVVEKFGIFGAGGRGGSKDDVGNGFLRLDWYDRACGHA